MTIAESVSSSIPASDKIQQPANQLKGLLLLAVGIVCAHHWLPPTVTHGILRGAYGAELLFACVGFFATDLCLRTQPLVKAGALQPRQALMRVFSIGFLRTLPVYFAFLLPVFFLSRGENDVHLALWTLTYNFYAAITGELTGTLAHMWAPSIAFQFFCLWVPCALFLERGRRVPVACGLIALGFLSRLCLAFGEAPAVVLRCAGVTSLDAFGSGALLSFLFDRYGVQRVSQHPWTRTLLWGGLAWIGFGMALQFDRHGGERALWETLVITTKVPFTFGTLAWAAGRASGPFGALLLSRPWQWLAGASGAAYLAHAFAPLLLRRFVSVPILPFGFLLLGILTLGVGVFLRYGFEVWFFRRAQRLASEPLVSQIEETLDRAA